MPTYEYQCEKCERVFEVRQRITEPPLTSHEACGGRVKRLLSPAPFILKGEGWYVTDYPSASRKKAMDAEKSSSSTTSTSDKSEKSDKAAPAPKTDGAASTTSTTGASSSASTAKSSD